VGEALDDLEGEGGGTDVEALAGFLTEQAEVVGGGEDFGMDDLADDGGQAFEGGAEFADAAGAGLGREGFSRRWNVGSSGGVGLFCLIFEELEEELVMAHLLALGSVNALEQGGDDAFLDGEIGFKVGDLGGEFFDLLFGCGDAARYSMWYAFPGDICLFFLLFHRISYQGRWRPSRRSMPSVSMARAVGLRMSLRRSPSMSCGQLKRPRSSLLATTQ